MYSMICFKILQYKTLHKSAERRISNNKNFNLFLAKHFSRVDYCGMTSNSRRVFKLFGHNDSILFNKNTRSVLYRYKMQNDKGEYIDAYIPRKW